MKISIFDILMLVSFGQGIILALAIWAMPMFRHSPGRYLALSVGMISIIGLDEWLTNWNLDDQYYLIDLLGDDVPWVLLFLVPMVRFFLASLDHPLATSPRFWWLTLPFGLFLLFNLWINGDVDAGWYQIPQVKTWQKYGYGLELYLAAGFNVILLAGTYRLVFRKKTKEPLVISHRWLRQIWVLVVGLVMLWIIGLAWPEAWKEGSQLLFVLLWLGVAAFMYWLTYQGLFRFQLAKDRAAIQALLSTDAGTEPPLEPLSPPNSAPSPYLQQLTNWMEEEQAYRDANLSRDLAAEELGISAGYLSQLLNAELGKSFPQYVADFRVQAVKKMLEEESFDAYSLVAIGQEAGFSSKSAFYATFKQVVGQTPAQYKRSLKQS
ncbi:MAG: helix-turn-helix domain-containing protein [Bacteroidota bacterium]